jgi:hypothetical protein
MPATQVTIRLEEEERKVDEARCVPREPRLRALASAHRRHMVRRADASEARPRTARARMRGCKSMVAKVKRAQ